MISEVGSLNCSDLKAGVVEWGCDSNVGDAKDCESGADVVDCGDSSGEALSGCDSIAGLMGLEYDSNVGVVRWCNSTETP